jgi:hypothetical protein
MKMKGLYGQAQGNESRQSVAVIQSHFDANHLVEGQHVATLRRMFADRSWTAFQQYTAELKKAGHAQYRIDAMIGQAGAGIKL